MSESITGIKSPTDAGIVLLKSPGGEVLSFGFDNDGRAHLSAETAARLAIRAGYTFEGVKYV